MVPKDGGRETRLIFHLSYSRSGKSVNSETDPQLCTVKYPDFSDAIKLCMELTKNKTDETVFSSKSDIKSAFRNLPISGKDFMLLIMKALSPIDGKIYYFVDKCLPFSASISCKLFQDFSDCIAFIFTYHAGKKTVNYLDDYYFAALLKALCDSQIHAFLEICYLICFPVSLKKTEWGSTVITFLRFLIDSENQIIGIPVEKIHRAIELITDMLNSKNSKPTLHKLQKLCGFLNYLCRCIVPRRTFTRRLYAFTSGVLLPHHHIRVNMEMKDDLKMWLTFLNHPTAYCRPFLDFKTKMDSRDTGLVN